MLGGSKENMKETTGVKYMKAMATEKYMKALQQRGVVKTKEAQERQKKENQVSLEQLMNLGEERRKDRIKKIGELNK